MTNGADLLPGVVGRIIPRKAPPPFVPDQNATTTDLSSIKPTPPQPVVSLPTKTYGPLTNIYTDQKYGFSIKYPDEMEVQNAGDGMGIYERGQSTFGLKICNPEAGCAMWDGDITPTIASLDDLKTAHTSRTENGKQQLTTTPLANATLVTGNGARVLKQTYTTVIRDENGKDVTSSDCESCGGEHRRYIVFKDPSHYVIVRAMNYTERPIEEQIIKSITF